MLTPLVEDANAPPVLAPPVLADELTTLAPPPPLPDERFTLGLAAQAPTAARPAKETAQAR
jgi:hypothetical protein